MMTPVFRRTCSLLLAAALAGAAWIGTTFIAYGNRLTSLEAVVPRIEKRLDSIDQKIDRALEHHRNR